MSEKRKANGLKVALPNGGLESNTRQLFADANLAIQGEFRKHDARVDDPLISQVTFMRPQHIPGLIANQTYDLGICGSDCVSEAGREVILKIKTRADLLYGRGDSTGRVQVVLVSARENTVSALHGVKPGSRILSEYPNITKRIFAKEKIPIVVEFSYGGTEAHIPRDYEFGVCLTDTGASLAANDLKIVEVLLQTNTVLIVNRCSLSTYTDRITAITHLLVGTLEARLHAFLTMNVLSVNKQAVLRALPALKQPTVTKLADRKHFSLGSVVSKREQNEVVIRVLRAGATDVLVQPILQIVRSW